MLFKLIYRNAVRHRLRTVLTVLGMAVAILSFGLLSTVITAWYGGVNASSDRRLVTRNAISLIFPLPVSYLNKIKAMPHVRAATFGTWFGGIYIDQKNFMPQFAIEPRSYLPIYPEFVLPPEQRDTFLRERASAIAGRKVAAKYGWRLGQKITLRGTIFPGDWELTIRGIYRGGRPSTDETQLLFHWDYLNERLKQTTPRRADQVGWYLVEIDDPKRAAEVSAAIDATFANSLAETLTETEKAFQLSFVSMTDAIIKAIQLISVVVIVIIMVVLANTMAMSARERAGEYAVLKTLGFSGRFLFGLIAGESVIIAAAGGALGIGLTFPAARIFGKALENFFPVFHVAPATVVEAAAAALLVGGLAALQPAWQASRVRIVEALGRVG
jgi:putative ABC transport system permease protein